MKKTKWIAVLAAVLAIVLAFGLTACRKKGANRKNPPKPSFTAVEAVPATCAEEGTEAYWKGKDGKLFSDKDGKAPIEKPVAIPKLKLTKVAEIPASCTKEGAREHWKCPKCGKLYSDKDGKNPIEKPTAIPKLKLTKVAEVPATCTAEGAKEHWKCPKCGKLYSDEAAKTPIEKPVSVPRIALIRHEAVAATHEAAGNIEYWECPKCGKKYSSAEASPETEIADVLIPKIGITKVERVEPTCTTEGTEAYYKDDADNLFSDAAGQTPIDKPVSVAKIALEHHEAVAATASKAGNIEYWECPKCHKKYSSAEASPETEIEDVSIPKLGLTRVEGVEPTCTTEGTEACYKDDEGKLFSDAEGKTEITAPVVLPKLTLDHHPAKDAIHTAAGNIEYWECPKCHKKYSSADASAETEITGEVSLAKIALEHRDRKDATCTEDGNVEYWECPKCHKTYKDENASEELENVSVPKVALTKVEAVAATASAAGNIEYWQCPTCGKKYRDAAASEELTDEQIAIKMIVLTPHERKEPTCTEDGHEAYWEGDNGKLYSGSEATPDQEMEAPASIDAPGHDFVLHSDKNEHWRICSKCGAEEEGSRVEHPFDSVTHVCPVCGRADPTPADKLVFVPDNAETPTCYTIKSYTGDDPYVVIPEEYEGKPVTKIAFDDSSNKEIVSLTLPASVTEIGGCGNCGKLKNLSAPGLKSINSYAFEDCGSLETVSLSGSLESVGAFAFGNCASLREIVLPEGLETIGMYAFIGCAALEKISLPEGLETIESGAFVGCAALEKISLPSTVSEIDADVFTGCAEKAEIVVDEANEVYAVSGNCLIETKDGKVTLKRGFSNSVIPQDMNITAIEQSAFEGCSGLTETAVPGTVVRIGSSAFRNTGLVNVTLPDSVTDIGQSAFEGCTSLESITLPAGLETIESKTFYNCTSLSSVTVPDSVTYVGSLALHGTAWYAAQPDGLVCAGKVAYSWKGDMPEGTSVTLPDGTKGIADRAFGGKDKLSSVFIPETVEKAGSAAFDGCSALYEIHYGGRMDKCPSFSGVPAQYVICEDGYVSVKYSTQRTAYADGLVYEVLTDGETAVGYAVSGKGTFDGECVAVPPVHSDGTNGVLPVTCIKDNAFAGDTAITSVILPHSLESVGADAFAGCSSLDVFMFNGPEALWKTVSKGMDWAEDVSPYADVRCADRTVSLYTFAHHEKIEASCTSSGTEEYWERSDGKLFSDAGHTTVIDAPVSIAKTELVHHPAKEATHMAAGNIEYWECTKCGKRYSSADASAETRITGEVSIAKIKLDHHDAVSATHEAAGNVEYWECPKCHKTYADENASEEIADVLIPKIGITKVEKVEPTCITEGTDAYYRDDEGKLFSDAGGKTEITAPVVLPKLTLDYHEAVEATHMAAGNKEYWECPKCGKKYSSAEASPETELADVSVPKVALTPVEKVEPTCTEEGTKAHWKCPKCGKLFSDEAGTTEISAPEPIAKVELTPHDAVAATHEAAGNVEYWECPKCGKKYSTAEASEDTELADVSVPKVALTPVEKVEPTCTKEGTEKYWKCPTCGKLFSDEAGTMEISAPVSIAKVELTPHDAVAATHEAAGNVEYWECPKCGKKYSTAEASPETELADVSVPKVALTPVDEVPATCTKEGTKAHWKCPKCGKLFSDEAGTTEISAPEPIAKIKLDHHDAVAATDEAAGNVEYWECPVCGKKYFSAEASPETEIADVVIPRNGLTKVEGVEPTCTTEGTAAYYKDDAENMFSDPDGKESITEPASIPKLTLDHHPAVEATHMAAGTKEYWECPKCHKKYSSAEASAETELADVSIEKIALKHHEKVEATCTKEGTKEYWECEKCGKLFSDEAGTTEISAPISIQKVSLTKVDAVAATASAAGNIEYWKCPICGKKYRDADASDELTDTVIPMIVLTPHERKEPTCTEDGHEAYWEGDNGKLYSGSEATPDQEMEAPVSIDALGHDFVLHSDKNEHWRACSRCGKEEEGSRVAHSFDSVTHVCPVCGRADPTPADKLVFVPDNAEAPASYTITRYTGEDPYVVIPDEYEGKPVKKLSFDDSSYKDIVSLTLPASVTEIGENCCKGYLNLTEVRLSEGLTVIGKGAFSGCSRLKGIDVPASVTDIGTEAFTGCGALESITVEEGNAKYRSEENCLIERQNNKLIAGCKSSKIPDSVTGIGSRAFMGCTGLKEITIPDSVTGAIGIDAFKDCTSLKTVSIGNGVTAVQKAFSGCTSLRNISIGDGVTAIDMLLFEGFESLKSVKLGSSVASIGMNAFNGCSSLESITLPVGLKTIGLQAFYNCTSLPSVTVPDTVTTIESSAFSGCTALESITLPAGLEKIERRTFYGCSSLASITIPDSVTGIGGHAFDGCASLASVTLGNSVAGIEEYAFYKCSSLSSLIIPDSVTSIGSQAFSLCFGLTNVTLGASVTSIGDSAFATCVRLIEVYNRSGLEITAGGTDNGYIGKVARNVYKTEGGSKLSTDENGYVIYTDGEDKLVVAYNGTDTALTLPDGTTEINQHAFFEYAFLTSVTIPDSVTRIEDGAFENCTSLVSIILPSSLTYIDNYAVVGCTALSEVYCCGTETQFEEIIYYVDNLPDKIYYYSETEPSGEGNFWHYDADGVTPVIWAKPE